MFRLLTCIALLTLSRDNDGPLLLFICHHMHRHKTSVKIKLDSALLKQAHLSICIL